MNYKEKTKQLRELRRSAHEEAVCCGITVTESYEKDHPFTSAVLNLRATLVKIAMLYGDDFLSNALGNDFEIEIPFS